MRSLLFRYGVSPDFLSVLHCFGDAPNLAEASSSKFAVQHLDEQTSTGGVHKEKHSISG